MAPFTLKQIDQKYELYIHGVMVVVKVQALSGMYKLFQTCVLPSFLAMSFTFIIAHNYALTKRKHTLPADMGPTSL
jgi:hypothetical protein